MGNEVFFLEQKEQSRVKTEIVAAFFMSWVNVILGSQKRYRPLNNNICYFDMFCGPGYYKDGSESTPIVILKLAISHSELRDKLIIRFNDKDSNVINDLKQSIIALPGIERLKHKPIITNNTIGREVIEYLNSFNRVPTLFFIDPCGFKGLTIDLILSTIRSWGCDCIFFFNYNRINMGLSNPLFKENMIDIFGEEKGESLIEQLSLLDVEERENAIINELYSAFKEKGCEYILPFRFIKESGKKTSHHLIYATKSFTGYDIMKNIMAKRCTGGKSGVPSFEYNPATERWPLLFNMNRSVDELEAMLLEEYAGTTMTVRELYQKHSVGKPYIMSNYKDILKKMSKEGKVITEPVKMKKANSMPDYVKITFPRI